MKVGSAAGENEGSSKKFSGASQPGEVSAGTLVFGTLGQGDDRSSGDEQANVLM